MELSGTRRTVPRVEGRHPSPGNLGPLKIPRIGLVLFIKTGQGLLLYKWFAGWGLQPRWHQAITQAAKITTKLGCEPTVHFFYQGADRRCSGFHRAPCYPQGQAVQHGSRCHSTRGGYSAFPPEV